MLTNKYIFYLLIAVILGFSAGSVFAQTPIPPRPIKTLDVKTSNLDDLAKKVQLPIIDIREDPCEKSQGFFNKLVVCTEALVNTAVTDTVIGSIHSGMKDAASGAVVLYIMFFGLKVMSRGVDKVRTEAFIVFMTATFIVFFNQTTQIVNYKNVFINIQKEFVELADKAITPDVMKDLMKAGDGSDVFQDKPEDCSKIDATTVPAGQNPMWHKMDCLVPQIFGAHPIVSRMRNCFNDGGKKDTATGQIDDKTGLLSGDCSGLDAEFNPSEKGKDFYKKHIKQGLKGMEGTVFAIFVILIGLLMDNSGQLGFIIIVTGIFVPVMLIIAFAQALYVYLTSFLGITILAVLAPIVLPCFLFQRTRQIFDQWLKILVSITLKPGILLIYLSFMIYILSSILTYAAVGSSNFRSYSDFLSGTSFTNSILKREEVASLNTNYGTEEYCYHIARDTKVVGQTSIEQVLEKEFGKRFPNVPANFLNSYKEKLEEYKGVEQIEQMVTDLFSKYVGDASSDCSQSSKGFKVLSYTFGDPNGVAKAPQDILISLMLKAHIPFVMVSSGSPNSPLVPVIDLASGKSIDQLKKSIINNDKINPNLPDSERYRDYFIKEYKKYYYSQQENFNSFLITLLVVLITLAITYTFMNNVIEFGDQMAGLAGSKAMGVSNFYAMVSERLNNSIYR